MKVIEQEYVAELPLVGLSEHPENPRQGHDETVGESIAQNGFYGAILVQRSTNRIIAGNTRYRQALAAGASFAPGFVCDVDDDQARRILLVDNRSSDMATMNDSSLTALLASIADSERGFYGTGFDEASYSALIESATNGYDINGNDSFEDNYGEFSGVKLADRFLAPPFSVLDGRAGYWRNRKRYWIEEVGITSETGREANLLNASAAMLRSKNWKGTSVFDPVLSELMYRWLAPEGGHIIDPFCGGSVRGLVASACGHTYEGYDLRSEQIEANEANAEAIGIPKDEWPQWKVGNSNAAVYEKPGDMLLTCPPYWSLEKYSDSPEDISSPDTIEEFREGYGACLAPATAALADDAFAVVVIASMRHKGGLYDLGGITIELMEEQGLTFFNDAILLTPLASAALRGARLFAGRKMVPVHQRVLMFVKGDPQKAIEKLPVVEIMRDEMALASWLDFDGGGELPPEAAEEVGDELEDET